MLSWSGVFLYPILTFSIRRNRLFRAYSDAARQHRTVQRDPPPSVPPHRIPGASDRISRQNNGHVRRMLRSSHGRQCSTFGLCIGPV